LKGEREELVGGARGRRLRRMGRLERTRDAQLGEIRLGEGDLGWLIEKVLLLGPVERRVSDGGGRLSGDGRLLWA
jgi:hypothetical protein